MDKLKTEFIALRKKPLTDESEIAKNGLAQNKIIEQSRPLTREQQNLLSKDMAVEILQAQQAKAALQDHALLTVSQRNRLKESEEEIAEAKKTLQKLEKRKAACFHVIAIDPRASIDSEGLLFGDN